MMNMIVAAGILLILMIGIYSYFLLKRLLSFYHFNVSKKRNKIFIICLSILVALVATSIFQLVGIVFLHFIIISMILDGITVLLRCFHIKSNRFTSLISKAYQSGVLILIITSLFIGYGKITINKIVETHYDITTSKNIRDYNIVLLTDIHYDTIQNTKLLKDKIDILNKQDNDIVILGGDIVEEGTSKEKMEEVFQILGSLNTRYGIYYVYGNHDRQTYATHKAYSEEELKSAIQINNIHILKDEYISINDELIIAGRDDAAWGNISNRKSSDDILSQVDRDKYIIMVDHQPIETVENNRAGVDLELSGHTHAGQIWPAGILNEMIGNLNYGRYQEGNLTTIVSSGVAGWGISLRTSKYCEYVTISLSHK